MSSFPRFFLCLAFASIALAPIAKGQQPGGFDTATFPFTVNDLASANGHVQWEAGSSVVVIALQDGQPRAAIPCTRVSDFHPKHVPGKMRFSVPIHVSAELFGDSRDGNPKLFTLLVAGYRADQTRVVPLTRDILGRSDGMNAQRHSSGTRFTPSSGVLDSVIEAQISEPLFDVHAALCSVGDSVSLLAVQSTTVDILTPN